MCSVILACVFLSILVIIILLFTPLLWLSINQSLSFLYCLVQETGKENFHYDPISNFSRIPFLHCAWFLDWFLPRGTLPSPTCRSRQISINVFNNVSLCMQTSSPGGKAPRSLCPKSSNVRVEYLLLFERGMDRIKKKVRRKKGRQTCNISIH